MALVTITENKLPYYRIVGYIITILMHLANTFVMMSSFKGDVMKDPNIQLFHSFMFKFITCWTFAAQTGHAALGLSCDLQTLAIGDHKFLKHMKQMRDILFASIVVPFTMLVPTCFWPLFLYDRELILPYYTTKIVGSVSNHIMHTAVIPATLWEMIFQPRQEPTSHKLNTCLMSSFAISYLVLIFKTYGEVGVFPYPLMTILFGTIYFFIFMVAVLAFLPIYYHCQWSVSRLLWRESAKKVC